MTLGDRSLTFVRRSADLRSIAPVITSHFRSGAVRNAHRERQDGAHAGRWLAVL